MLIDPEFKGGEWSKCKQRNIFCLLLIFHFACDQIRTYGETTSDTTSEQVIDRQMFICL